MWYDILHIFELVIAQLSKSTLTCHSFIENIKLLRKGINSKKTKWEDTIINQYNVNVYYIYLLNYIILIYLL